MNISRVTYERLDLKLSEPYTIAYETVSSTTNFIIQLHTTKGIIGYGCAAPDLEVTGETPDEVERCINNQLIPFLENQDPLRYVFLLYKLKELLPSNPSILAMVDMALLDICSKRMEVPLYVFLGGYRRSIATSITIGILDLSTTLAKAREFVDQGFTIIKIKGGLDVEQDIEKIIKIREALPNVILRFDGNQGYDLDDAITFEEGTDSAKIEIFEQPSHIKRDSLLGEITNAVSLPVMADESLKSLSDAFRLAQNERIDMVNVKLQKVGGIVEGLHINSVAKSAKLEVMVGCIDECGLGIAAGLHFALSRPNIEYADLDGHLDLLGDPYKDLFQLKNGVLTPNEKSGLGV